MSSSVIFVLLCGILCAVKSQHDIEPAVLNHSPIVGVLSQEIDYSFNKRYPGQYHSYISTQYVKFLESAGAKVAPIWIGKPREYYVNLLSKINGVLFPGGRTFFNQSDGYAEAGAHIYEIARQMNDEGKYMPLWGVCLGFELLTYLSANGTEHRTHCWSSNVEPLEFKDGFKQSRLFGSAPEDVIEILANERAAPNFHQFCVTEQNLTEFGLAKEWKVLSVNQDWNGIEFVSTIEHTKYPFYGLQYHSELNTFGWRKNLTGTINSIKTTQYFANFFVSEARKSPNRFSTEMDAYSSLIYNYPPFFTAREGLGRFQVYFFTKEDISDSEGMSVY